MSESNEVRPHSTKQERIIFSDSPITIAATGTQFGKSMAGSLWMKRQIHTYTDKSDNFLLLAPSYKIMQQSMLPYFLNAMENFGEYRKSDGIFALHQGGMVYMRTETDPDSVVGIPRVRAYWLDEAGKARLYFHENIQARAASVGAKGLYTTSPYSRNWLYKDYVKPKLEGKLPKIELIQAASWENPYHTLHDPAKRAEMQAQMDPRRFAMVFGGEFGQMVGLVYDCWDDDQNLIEPFQLPQGCKIVGGIDWGYYPDPFVVKIRVITPDGRHYGISEFAKTHLTLPDIVKVVQQKKQVFGVSLFYCDPSNPGAIEELNRNGIPSIGADNDIRRGIDLHYELIKTRRYKEFKGTCPYSLDERELYHYPELKDLKDDQGSKELLPVDKDNHCFPGYIKILTQRGWVRIDQITARDLVWTRAGWNRVLTVWNNGFKPVFRFNLSNGQWIDCTENHRIYTANRGFVEARSLMQSDIFVISPLWKPHRLKSFLMGFGFGEIRTILNRTCETITAVLRYISKMEFAISIARYGNTILDQFLKAIMSITRTGTPSITTQTILNASRLENTLVSMKESEAQTLCSSQSGKSMSGPCKKWPSAGTNPNLGGSGIASTCAQSAISLIHSHSERPANLARMYSKLTTWLFKRARPVFVPMPASLRIVGSQELMTSTESALPANECSASISTSRNDSAPTSVDRVKLFETEVYDLTVESEHEYFADGVLVHNCMDTDRYITIMSYRSQVKVSPKVQAEGKREESLEQHLERLKRKRGSAHSENWSS